MGFVFFLLKSAPPLRYKYTYIIPQSNYFYNHLLYLYLFLFYNYKSNYYFNLFYSKLKNRTFSYSKPIKMSCPP